MWIIQFYKMGKDFIRTTKKIFLTFIILNVNSEELNG